MESQNITLEEMKAGDDHYKAYVGPPKNYDRVAAMQFNLLTAFGLLGDHKLVDIGCGSLRPGKLFIPYLRKGNYYGIEPNEWLVKEGIKNELGNEIMQIKSPTFIHTDQFELSKFGVKFDYMVAQSIFSHTSQAQVHQCLKEVKKTLKPGGMFLATFIQGYENYDGDEWVYPGCVRFTNSFIKKMVRQDGLDCFRTQWQHPNGQTWYVIFHPENRSNVAKRVRKHLRTNKRELPWKRFLQRYKLFNSAGLINFYRKVTGSDKTG